MFMELPNYRNTKFWQSKWSLGFPHTGQSPFPFASQLAALTPKFQPAAGQVQTTSQRSPDSLKVHIFVTYEYYLDILHFSDSDGRRRVHLRVRADTCRCRGQQKMKLAETEGILSKNAFRIWPSTHIVFRLPCQYIVVFHLIAGPLHIRRPVQIPLQMPIPPDFVLRVQILRIRSQAFSSLL